MKAYYFADEDRKLRYGDNRNIIVGETHSVSLKNNPLKLCEWGKLRWKAYMIMLNIIKEMENENNSTN